MNRVTLKYGLLGLFLVVQCTNCFPKYVNKYDFNNLDENQDAKNTCGYESCPKPVDGMLNIHLVPHTHDDVGWLKTVDQYYYGSNNSIQTAGVQYIIDSVINELVKDPKKKFIYVETAFLWKWWLEQHDSRRHQVKQLINNGQLEIIGGAWSMNDEAVTHYHSIVDQFTWGFRKLNDTFGACSRPKIGWQIDPFGHSREMASLFAQMGFDGLFFGRLDVQDKAQRLKDKTAEMIWKGSASLGKDAELFTGALYNQYQPPPGFCFDIVCSDQPIIDNKRSPDYNVNSRVSELLSFAEEQSKGYQTNNVIITMGGDFTYQQADTWYKNLDKLIRYINELQNNGTKVNAFYSTPSCYLKALNDANKTWPTKSDDFFPYGSDPHTYWTGYFTSRPTIKLFERKGNNMLQVCKQLAALTRNSDSETVDESAVNGLNDLREAMGIMQHHDAVTGTEKQHVADDYSRILHEAIEECGNIAEDALNSILTKGNTQETPKLPLEQCLLLNNSQCAVTEQNDQFVVVLYNPLSRPVSQYVRLPVTGSDYSVKNPKGDEITTQIIPIPDAILNLPGRESVAQNELVFKAQDIPPLGYNAYYISKNKTADYFAVPYEISTDNRIGNGVAQVEIDKNDGKVHSVKFRDEVVSVQQDFLYYVGAVGNNAESKNRSSGAYIFRPNGTIKAITNNVTSKVYKGALVEEIHQVFNPWVSQVVRTYQNEEYVEFDWIVGPIPLDDKIGKEVISRFTTNLTTQSTFYTDSNGRELIRRVLNHRDTWNVSLLEPVAGNYYPVTSRIVIEDTKQNVRLAVLTDRAQGGSSLKDGEVELMVHRRLIHDDLFGVDEVLNETAYGGIGLVARGQHYLVYGSNNQSPTVAALERAVAQEKILAPWIFLSSAEKLTFDQFKSQYVLSYSGLKAALPSNVQILTLEPWKNGSWLLRLEHILEKSEDPVLSKPVTVDIENLFAAGSVTSIQELTLGANQLASESKRLQWKTVNDNQYEIKSKLLDQDALKKRRGQSTNDVDTKITLNPMQIRTFIIEAI